MRIRVNGEEQEVREGASLADLLQVLDIPVANVVVERNGEIVPRASLDAVRASAGDRLEIVRFVGGG